MSKTLFSEGGIAGFLGTWALVVILGCLLFGCELPEAKGNASETAGSGSMSGSESAHGSHSARSEERTEKAAVWTCPMHTQIRKPEPGRCPICSMSLVRGE